MVCSKNLAAQIFTATTKTNIRVIREIRAKKMKHQDLTSKIIECAYKVHNSLGFGFLEAVYQNALLIELLKAGLRAEKEKKIQVYYDNQVVGDYVADIIVEDKVILELKSVKDLHPVHEVQLVNYLKATGIEVGFLINFGQSVEIKRKLYTSPKDCS
jgi:GxxExxY protein